MYGNDDSSLIGYPYTDHAPLLDQPNLFPQSTITTYYHEHVFDAMGYNNIVSRMGLLSEAEYDTNRVARVLSAGDLQVNAVQHYSRSESPLSSESSSIIESMARACPYGPEEKKEKIERYRTKRNQRNFTKKIKYECRKTLADRRPRVRGRFAKNDEIEKNSQSGQWSQECVQRDYEDYDNWLNFLDSFSANIIP